MFETKNLALLGVNGKKIATIVVSTGKYWTETRVIPIDPKECLPDVSTKSDCVLPKNDSTYCHHICLVVMWNIVSIVLSLPILLCSLLSNNISLFERLGSMNVFLHLHILMCIIVQLIHSCKIMSYWQFMACNFVLIYTLHLSTAMIWYM